MGSSGSLNSCKKTNCIYRNHYNWIIFGAFLVLALGIWFSGDNQKLFLTINSYHTIAPDSVWLAFNLLTYSRFLILPILLVIISLLFKRDKFLNIILLIIAYFVVFAILKTVIGEARPYITLPEGSFYWLNSYENSIKSAYKSFPSGHTGNMAIFAFTISSLFFANKKFLQFLMLLLLIVTGLARIYTGWHWPLDVIASGLIGYVLVRICLAVDLHILFQKIR